MFLKLSIVYAAVEDQDMCNLLSNVIFSFQVIGFCFNGVVMECNLCVVYYRMSPLGPSGKDPCALYFVTDNLWRVLSLKNQNDIS